MKIVLLGYMASGKSAVGKALAQKKSMQFTDLDDFIEKKENLSIPEIFDNKGEIYFRIKEGEYLQELLNSEKDMIISLGGGTPCYGNNLDFIKNNSFSIYLKASIQTIFNRLKDETLQRPLVATIGKENLKEYVAKHLFERNPFYEKADTTIAVNDKEISEIVEELQGLF